MNFSAGHSFEPDKLDLTGKCALPVIKNAIEKNCSIKVYQTFSECCVPCKLLYEKLKCYCN